MSVPLILAVVSHFFLFQWRWFKKRWKGVLLATCLCLLIALPYLHDSLISHQQHPAFDFHPALRSLDFALSGARLFSSLDFDYFLGERWFAVNSPVSTPLLLALISISALAYVFFWFGLYRAIRSLITLGRSAPEYSLAVLLLLGFAFFLITNLVNKLNTHPHYYNAAWPIIFLLLWWAATTLWERSTWAAAAVCVYGIAIVLSTIAIAIYVHHNSGARFLRYGPTLGNWVEVAKTLNEYSPNSPIRVTIDHPHFSPVIETLRELYRDGSTSAQPFKRLRVSYEFPNLPRNAKMIVIEE
jgi:4-amino-4-deoxy-L-arabinose transferase-like glycosyltransferase